MIYYIIFKYNKSYLTKHQSTILITIFYLFFVITIYNLNKLFGYVLNLFVFFEYYQKMELSDFIISL